MGRLFSNATEQNIAAVVSVCCEPSQYDSVNLVLWSGAIKLRSHLISITVHALRLAEISSRYLHHDKTTGVRAALHSVVTWLSLTRKHSRPTPLTEVGQDIKVLPSIDAAPNLRVFLYNCTTKVSGQGLD